MQQDQTYVSVPGDIILGDLFPVHEKGEYGPCGPQVYHRGVQRLEAMMFAVNTINKNETLLPNVALGVHILDTYGRETYALNQSLQFVRLVHWRPIESGRFFYQCILARKISPFILT